MIANRHRMPVSVGLVVMGLVHISISGCTSCNNPRSASIAPFPPRPHYSSDINLRKANSNGYRTRWVATTMPRKELEWEREPPPGYTKDEKEAWRRGAMAVDLMRLNEWISQNQGTYGY